MKKVGKFAHETDFVNKTVKEINKVKVSDKKCTSCGKVFKEGEVHKIFVDPGSEWWLNLADLPPYCMKCARKSRKEKESN